MVKVASQSVKSFMKIAPNPKSQWLGNFNIDNEQLCTYYDRLVLELVWRNIHRRNVQQFSPEVGFMIAMMAVRYIDHAVG